MIKTTNIVSMKLRRGDMVKVISGSAKGATGKILRVYPSLNSVTVEGVNQFKRNVKPGPGQTRGGTREIHKPIDVSNVAILADSKSGKTSRIGYKVDASGKKVRILKQAKDKEID